MTAKEMFEALGYKFNQKSDFDFRWINKDFFIYFDLNYSNYSVCFNNVNKNDNPDISIKLHKAITQQMKELGWIE